MKLLKEIFINLLLEADDDDDEPELKRKKKPEEKRTTRPVMDRPGPELEPELDYIRKQAERKADLPAKQTEKDAERATQVNTGDEATPGETRAFVQQAMQDLSAGSRQLWNQFMDRTKDITDIVPDDMAATFAFNPEAEGTEVPVPVPEPEPANPEALERIQEPGTKRYTGKRQQHKLNVKWHKVRNLPGYMLQQVRGMFRQYFQYHTDAQLEELSVGTTLGNNTSEVDMRMLIGWIAKYGEKLSEHDVALPQVIDPEQYQCKVVIYKVPDGNVYALVKEFRMGEIDYYAYRAKWKGDMNKLPQHIVPLEDDEYSDED